MYRLSALLTTVFVFAAVIGCSDTPTGPMESEGPDTQVRSGATEPAQTAKVAPAAEAAEHTYEVTITNLTGGQPLAPPLLVTHAKKADLFEAGEAAGGHRGQRRNRRPSGTEHQQLSCQSAVQRRDLCGQMGH